MFGSPQGAIQGSQANGQLETRIGGMRLVANLDWAEGSKNFEVVGKASDLRQQDLIKADLQAGNVKEMSVTFSFGYSVNRFQTAVLRAAYLVLFRGFGYEYVQCEIVQILRRRICDTSLEFPRLGSFIMELRNCDLPADEQHLIANGDVNGVKFFLVLLRAQKHTVTNLGVFMPFPKEDSREYFDLMEQCSREFHGQRLTIPLRRNHMRLSEHASAYGLGSGDWAAATRESAILFPLPAIKPARSLPVRLDRLVYRGLVPGARWARAGGAPCGQ